jgi:signal transduction histidine kinase
LNTEIRIVNPKEYPLPGPPAWMESWIIRGRFWIFGIFCLAIIAIENFIEPILNNDPQFSEFSEDVVFFFVVVSFGILAEILLRTIIAKSFAVGLLEIKHQLSIRLETASDWNKLTDLILAFCEAVADPERIVLLLHMQTGGFEVAAQSQTREYLEAHKGTGVIVNDFCVCIDGAEDSMHTIKPNSESIDDVSLHGYCLPLIKGGQCIAKLDFYVPQGICLNERQIDIFKNCASDVAIAINTAQMRKVQQVLLIEQARYVERHEISRNLHDVLGQKLIYLRFKLDQFINSNERRPLPDIYCELEQMLAVANESCELVRGTLAILNSNDPPSLLKVLAEHSRLMVKRTQWELTFDEIGSPHTLPPETSQQILYIFGEALNNVERHAAAQKVDMKLIWSDTDLIIKIADNGRGFEPAKSQKEGHYGLRFMRERAEILRGCIDVCSSLDEGTQLTIELPINDNRDGASAPDFHGSLAVLNAN